MNTSALFPFLPGITFVLFIALAVLDLQATRNVIRAEARVRDDEK